MTPFEFYPMHSWHSEKKNESTDITETSVLWWENVWYVFFWNNSENKYFLLIHALIHLYIVMIFLMEQIFLLFFRPESEVHSNLKTVVLMATINFICSLRN